MTNILFIRTRHDDWTTKTFSTAQAVLTYAKSKKYFITELNENQATKKNVETAFKEMPIDFVIHYGHGDIDRLYGQDKNKKQTIIDIATVDGLLKGRTKVSTVSCFSAEKLGPIATRENSTSAKGTNAYLGYKVEIAYPDVFVAEFREAFNAGFQELLDLNTFQYAYDKKVTVHENNYKTIVESTDPSIDPIEQFFAAAALLYARNGLKLCGDPNAVI